MSQMKVKVCNFCGRLFQSMGPDVCPECSVRLDEDFVKVREYLYDSSAPMDVMDIVKNTDVSEKAVLRFVKEGRLSRTASASETKLKCAICGAPISSGRLCQNCLRDWKAETGGRGAANEKTGGSQKDVQAGKSSKMHTLHR